MKEIKDFTPNAAQMIDKLLSIIQRLQSPNPEADDPGFKQHINEAAVDAYKTVSLLQREGGYVYALVADVPGERLVKIGYSEHVSDRLAKLAIQIPFPVRVGAIIVCDNARETETALHRKFDENRRNGEWFYVPSMKDVYRAFVDAGTIHFYDPADFDIWDEVIASIKSTHGEVNVLPF